MAVKTCLTCVHYQHDNRDPGGVLLKCVKHLVNVSPETRQCWSYKPCKGPGK